MTPKEVYKVVRKGGVWVVDTITNPPWWEFGPKTFTCLQTALIVAEGNNRKL